MLKQPINTLAMSWEGGKYHLMHLTSFFNDFLTENWHLFGIFGRISFPCYQITCIKLDTLITIALIFWTTRSLVRKKTVFHSFPPHMIGKRLADDWLIELFKIKKNSHLIQWCQEGKFHNFSNLVLSLCSEFSDTWTYQCTKYTCYVLHGSELLPWSNQA